MNLSFENKVALVTGAGAGMGLAAANAFAEAGASVALADINEAVVRAAAEQLVAAGHKAIALRCDVAHDDQVKAMWKKLFRPLAVWTPRSTMLACRARR